MDIYVGETYDSRLATPGWTLPDFDDSTWSKAITVNPPSATVKVEGGEGVDKK
jgi:alpha-L-rhamnosidase